MKQFSFQNYVEKYHVLSHNNFNGGQHKGSFYFLHSTQRWDRYIESQFGQNQKLTQVRAPCTILSSLYFRLNSSQLISLCYKFIHPSHDHKQNSYSPISLDYSQWSFAIDPRYNPSKRQPIFSQGTKLRFLQIFPSGHWVYWSQIQPEKSNQFSVRFLNRWPLYHEAWQWTVKK